MNEEDKFKTQKLYDFILRESNKAAADYYLACVGTSRIYLNIGNAMYWASSPQDRDFWERLYYKYKLEPNISRLGNKFD